MGATRAKQVRARSGEITLDEYQRWLRSLLPPHVQEEEIRKQLRQTEKKDGFVFVLRISFDESTEIRTTLNSLFSQIYPAWRLVIVQSAPGEAALSAEIETLQKEEGHTTLLKIQDGTNIWMRLSQILAQTPGQWISFISPGDVLANDALAELLFYINRIPDTEMIYSDEDSIAPNGIRHSPYFKPDWSPDLLLSHNYVGRLVAYRKDIFLRMGSNLDTPYPLEDYELALRFTELTNAIGHVSKILYSRKSSEGDLNPEADRARLLITFARRGWTAEVEEVSDYPGYLRAHWIPKDQPLISILICTKDKPYLLGRCLASIFGRSEYQEFEVMLVDNGSRDKETFLLFNEWQEKEPVRFRILRLDEPFNFSRLNNRAAEYARGELLLFLNNDTEICSPDWLQEMAGQACRPEIGTVGALLLFPDGSIQHAGIIVGGKMLAVHSQRGWPGNSPGYKGRLLAPSNVSALSAACLMIRKELFRSHSGFDERLAVSYGDVDLCLRLGRAGYYHVLLPHIRLMHAESASRGYDTSAEKRARLREESSYLTNLHPQLAYGDPFYNPNLSEARGDFSLRIT